MYAITLKQPWVYYILYHGKDVENRTWKLPESRKNEWIALHAGKTFDIDHCPSISLDKNQFSAILGFIQFSDCITNSTSEWAIENQYHWIISQKIMLKNPIPCKGKLGFWKVDTPLPALANEILNNSFSVESSKFQYQKFLLLVEQMRMYQKDYFDTRSGYSLKRAKELEKQVDNAIDELTNPSQQIQQMNLFNHDY